MTAAPVRLGDRMVAVVESFLLCGTQSLSQVAAACGLEPPTATRYLRQLTEHGWLERDHESKEYRLGIRLVEIGRAARESRPLLSVVRPHMRQLLDRFDETVSLAVHEGDGIVIIDGLESRRSIRRGANVGERDSWFVSSLGKAIMAHLPPTEVARLATAFPFVARTPNSIRDADALMTELEQIRQQGYSVDDEESEIGLKCVGVALCDPSGQYSHALSISGPTARIDRRLDEIVAALMAAGRAAGRGNVVVAT